MSLIRRAAGRRAEQSFWADLDQLDDIYEDVSEDASVLEPDWDEKTWTEVAEQTIVRARQQGFLFLGNGAERAVLQKGEFAFKIPLVDPEVVAGGNLWEWRLWDTAPPKIKQHLAPVLAVGNTALVMPLLESVSPRDHGWATNLAVLQRAHPFFQHEEVLPRMQWGRTADGRYLLRDYGFKWRW